MTEAAATVAEEHSEELESRSIGAKGARRGSRGKLGFLRGQRRRRSSKTGHSFADLVQAQLGASVYHAVATVTLLEMRLLVFAHTSVAECVSAVETAKSACGIANVWGNKGGLVCALRVQGTSGYTSLCFTSCFVQSLGR